MNETKHKRPLPIITISFPANDKFLDPTNLSLNEPKSSFQFLSQNSGKFRSQAHNDINNNPNKNQNPLL